MHFCVTHSASHLATPLNTTKLSCSVWVFDSSCNWRSIVAFFFSPSVFNVNSYAKSSPLCQFTYMGGRRITSGESSNFKTKHGPLCDGACILLLLSFLTFGEVSHIVLSSQYPTLLCHNTFHVYIHEHFITCLPYML